MKSFCRVISIFISLVLIFNSFVLGKNQLLAGTINLSPESPWNRPEFSAFLLKVASAIQEMKSAAVESNGVRASGLASLRTILADMLPASVSGNDLSLLYDDQSKSALLYSSSTADPGSVYCFWLAEDSGDPFAGISAAARSEIGGLIIEEYSRTEEINSRLTGIIGSGATVVNPQMLAVILGRLGDLQYLEEMILQSERSGNIALARFFADILLLLEDEDPNGVRVVLGVLTERIADFKLKEYLKYNLIMNSYKNFTEIELFNSVYNEEELLFLLDFMSGKIRQSSGDPKTLCEITKDAFVLLRNSNTPEDAIRLVSAKLFGFYNDYFHQMPEDAAEAIYDVLMQLKELSRSAQSYFLKALVGYYGGEEHDGFRDFVFDFVRKRNIDFLSLEYQDYFCNDLISLLRSIREQETDDFDASINVGLAKSLIILLREFRFKKGAFKKLRRELVSFHKYSSCAELRDLALDSLMVISANLVKSSENEPSKSELLQKVSFGREYSDRDVQVEEEIDLFVLEPLILNLILTTNIIQDSILLIQGEKLRLDEIDAIEVSYIAKGSNKDVHRIIVKKGEMEYMFVLNRLMQPELELLLEEVCALYEGDYHYPRRKRLYSLPGVMSCEKAFPSQGSFYQDANGTCAFTEEFIEGEEFSRVWYPTDSEREAGTGAYKIRSGHLQRLADESKEEYAKRIKRIMKKTVEVIIHSYVSVGKKFIIDDHNLRNYLISDSEESGRAMIVDIGSHSSVSDNLDVYRIIMGTLMDDVNALAENTYPDITGNIIDYQDVYEAMIQASDFEAVMILVDAFTEKHYHSKWNRVKDTGEEQALEEFLRSIDKDILLSLYIKGYSQNQGEQLFFSSWSVEDYYDFSSLLKWKFSLLCQVDDADIFNQLLRIDHGRGAEVLVKLRNEISSAGSIDEEDRALLSSIDSYFGQISRDDIERIFSKDKIDEYRAQRVGREAFEEEKALQLQVEATVSRCDKQKFLKLLGNDPETSEYWAEVSGSMEEAKKFHEEWAPRAEGDIAFSFNGVRYVMDINTLRKVQAWSRYSKYEVGGDFKACYKDGSWRIADFIPRGKLSYWDGSFAVQGLKVLSRNIADIKEAAKELGLYSEEDVIPREKGYRYLDLHTHIESTNYPLCPSQIDMVYAGNIKEVCFVYSLAAKSLIAYDGKGSKVVFTIPRDDENGSGEPAGIVKAPGAEALDEDAENGNQRTGPEHLQGIKVALGSRWRGALGKAEVGLMERDVEGVEWIGELEALAARKIADWTRETGREVNVKMPDRTKRALIIAQADLDYMASKGVSEERLQILLQGALLVDAQVNGTDYSRLRDGTVFSLLDSSMHVGENCRADGFIGINKIVFDLPLDLRDTLFVLTFVHEARHEAGEVRGLANDYLWRDAAFLTELCDDHIINQLLNEDLDIEIAGENREAIENLVVAVEEIIQVFQRAGLSVSRREIKKALLSNEGVPADIAQDLRSVIITLQTKIPNDMTIAGIVMHLGGIWSEHLAGLMDYRGIVVLIRLLKAATDFSTDEVPVPDKGGKNASSTVVEEERLRAQMARAFSNGHAIAFSGRNIVSILSNLDTIIELGMSAGFLVNNLLTSGIQEIAGGEKQRAREYLGAYFADKQNIVFFRERIRMLLSRINSAGEQKDSILRRRMVIFIEDPELFLSGVVLGHAGTAGSDISGEIPSIYFHLGQIENTADFQHLLQHEDWHLSGGLNPGAVDINGHPYQNEHERDAVCALLSRQQPVSLPYFQEVDFDVVIEPGACANASLLQEKVNRAVNSLFAGVVPRVAPDRAMLENCARAHCGNVFQSGFTVPQSLAQFDSLYRQLQQHPYFYDYDYFPVVVIGVDPSLQSEYVMPAPEVGYPEGIAPAVASVRIDHMDRAIYIDFPTADYADQLTYRELVFLLLYSFMFFEEAQSLPSLNPATIVEPGILMLVNQCIDAGSLLYQQQFSDSVRGQIIDNISIISEGTVNSTEATAEKQAVRDALRELLNPPAGWSWPLYFRNILSVLLGWNHPDQKLKIIIADKPKAGYPGDDTNPYGKYDATSNTVCLFRHQFEDYENGKRVSAANLFTGQYMASVLLEELLHGAVCPLDTLLFLRAGHFSGYKTENLLRGFDWENFTKSMAENVGSSDRETRRYMIVREILKAADQVHYYLQREQVQELMGSRFVPPGQEQQVDTVGADSGIEHEVIINLRVDWRYRKLRQSGMDHKKALSYANVVNRTRLGCHSGIDIVPQTLLGRIGNEIVTAEIQLRQDEQAEDTYYLYTNYQNQFWRVGRCLMQIEGNSVSYIFHFDRQFSYFRLSTDVLTTVVNCLRRYHEAVQPRNVTVHIQDVPAEGRPFVVVHHDRDRIRKVPVQPILSGIADLEDAPASKNDFCGFELDSDEGESVWVRVDPDKGIEYGIMARVGTAGQREFIVADSETQAMMEEEFGDEIFELPEARRFFREQQRQQRRIRQAV